MKIQFELASSEDASRLSAALQQLATELGDPWPSGNAAALSQALDPAHRSLWAILATAGEEIRGAVAFTPYFSTFKGSPGLIVSDLWISAELRGQHQGPRLLAAAGRHARQQWGAEFLKLSVYDDNPRARAFYLRLGFEAAEEESNLSLHQHFNKLLENTP